MHRHAMNTSDPSPRILMACIWDASRFRLVQALLGGARCVTDLASEVGLSQSCTTRHLQALERRRVVCGARDGKRVLYRLCHDQPALGSLLAWALTPEGALIPAPKDVPTARAPRRAAQPGRVRQARATSERDGGAAVRKSARRTLTRATSAVTSAKPSKAVAPAPAPSSRGVVPAPVPQRSGTRGGVDATQVTPTAEGAQAREPRPDAPRPRHRSEIEDYLL